MALASSFPPRKKWTTGGLTRVSAAWMHRLDAGQHRFDDAVAPLAVEAEDLLGHAVELLGERRAKARLRAEETTPYRRGGNAQSRGGFVDRHVLDLAEHEDGPVRFG